MSNHLAVLPRGGLGDLLYHALFCKYIQDYRPEFKPLLVAGSYGKFLTSLLNVPHLPVTTFLADASAGLRPRSEVRFFSAMREMSGGQLASFTNDVIDHGLAKFMSLRPFDNRVLGNSTVVFDAAPGRFSRYRLNRVLGYQRTGRVNPKHLVDRQQHALTEHGGAVRLAPYYKDIWSKAVSPKLDAKTDANLVVIFPETAHAEKNLRPEQIAFLVARLQPQYKVQIFTRDPKRFAWLRAETVGFQDRMEPLRQVHSAAAVISADTFGAHLAGLSGTPCYTIYNFAYRPRWCEYWGSPYDNVLHFEAGQCYRLTQSFEAANATENSVIFDAVLAASRSVQSSEAQEPQQVLTGYAAR